MATKRQRIIQAIHDRLTNATSAGVRIYRSRLSFGSEDTFPLISIIPVESSVTEYLGEKEKIELPLSITAAIDADLDNPGDQVETLLGEIKTALFSGDNDSFQAVGTDRAKIRHTGDDGVSHDDGDDYITASVQLVIEYIEITGAPDT